jgi:acetyl-CoA carboxylase biotin carboxyl carrier protein
MSFRPLTDLAYLKNLIDLVSSTGIAELEIVQGDERLRIVGTGGSSHVVPASQSPSPLAAPSKTQPLPRAGPKPIAAVLAPTINAPIFGVCHLTPSPGSPAFVSVGDTIAVGQTLCLIEAMKMFSKVEATRAGIVKAVLVDGGQEVDAGQPLFRIE